MKIFEGLGCVTSDERLEFDDDAFTIRIMTQIQEFLKEFFCCGMGAIVRNLLINSRNCRRIVMKYLTGMGCVASKKD